MPRRGGARGGGAAAAGVPRASTCVPRRVHRPVAARERHLPGLPVRRAAAGTAPTPTGGRIRRQSLPDVKLPLIFDENLE